MGVGKALNEVPEVISKSVDFSLTIGLVLILFLIYRTKCKREFLSLIMSVR